MDLDMFLSIDQDLQSNSSRVVDSINYLVVLTCVECYKLIVID
jgi:hypothetical protein